MLTNRYARTLCYVLLIFVLGLLRLAPASGQYIYQTKPYKAVDLGPAIELNALTIINGSVIKAVGQRKVVVDPYWGDTAIFGFACDVNRSSVSASCANLQVPKFTFGDGKATTVTFDVDGITILGVTGQRPVRWNASGNSNFPTRNDACPENPTMITTPTAISSNTHWASGYCSTNADIRSWDRVPIFWDMWAGTPLAYRLETWGTPGRAMDMNNTTNRTVVGEVNGAAAVWWSPFEYPGFLGQNLHEATGINDSFVITGNGKFSIGSQSQERGFIRHPNTAVYRTLLPATASDGTYFDNASAVRINNGGYVVGSMWKGLAPWVKKAALWNSVGGFADLTAITSGLPAGVVLSDARDIDDYGDVAAVGFVNGELHAFVLISQYTPTFNSGPLSY